MEVASKSGKSLLFRFESCGKTLRPLSLLIHQLFLLCFASSFFFFKRLFDAVNLKTVSSAFGEETGLFVETCN